MAIPHFALIANVIQMAVHNKVNQEYCPVEDRRYRPGDVAIGGGYLNDWFSGWVLTANFSASSLS